MNRHFKKYLFKNIKRNYHIINNPQNFVKGLIYGRSDYTPDQKDLLESVGNMNIKEMKIVRTPLGLFSTTILNFLTMGKFNDAHPYDKLFHLRIFVKMDNDQIISVEKNEIINIKSNPKTNNRDEFFNVSINHPITLNELLNNTQQFMGQKYFYYDMRHNNCQDYIVAILKANHLDTYENLSFTKQDTKQIFEKYKSLGQLGRLLSDLANRQTVYYNGGSLRLGINNALTDQQINSILKHDPKYAGCFMKDQLPKRLMPNKWYVVNMQSSLDGMGTHWICFKNSSPLIYFDALIGGDPPIEIMQHAKHGILYEPKEIQSVSSTACGFYCIGCILSDKGQGSAVEHFKRFCSRFSKNTTLNDRILKSLLLSYNVVD